MIMELSPTWSELMEVASGIRPGRTFAPPRDARNSKPETRNSPAPHARRKPDITLPMLEACKAATDHEFGLIEAPPSIRKALVLRGLAGFKYDGQNNDNAYLSHNGYTLIRTQYDGLKRLLSEAASTAV